MYSSAVSISYCTNCVMMRACVTERELIIDDSILDASNHGSIDRFRVDSSTNECLISREYLISIALSISIIDPETFEKDSFNQD